MGPGVGWRPRGGDLGLGAAGGGGVGVGWSSLVIALHGGRGVGGGIWGSRVYVARGRDILIYKPYL